MLKSQRAAYAALTVAGLLWGFGFPLGKVAFSQMPVGVMVTYRFAFASLALLPLLFLGGARPLLRPKRLAQLGIAAALYVPIQFLLQFKGLSLTSVSHAALMVALLPGMIAISSALFFKRPLRRGIVAAIVLSVAGAALIAGGNGHNSNLWGDALVLLSLFSAVAWIAFTERYLDDVPIVPATTLMMLFGTAMLAVVEVPLHPHDFVRAYGPAEWGAVAISGILCTALTTLLWNAALRRVDPSRAGVFLNLEPVAGAVCGVLFFGDTFGLPLILGGALVLAGAIYVTARPTTQEQRPLDRAA